MDNTLKVLNMTGGDAGEYTFDAALLESVKGEQAVKDTVVSFLNGLRATTAHTKSKGMVRGGGAKPWRQKGTGRARAGSNRSPIWRGGGVVFGPQSNANYNKKVNKKVRRLALRRAFTERLIEGSIVIVDDLKIANMKTKEVVAFLKNINVAQDALILVDEFEPNLFFGAANLPRVDVLEADLVNVYNLLLFKKIIIGKSALGAIESRLKGEKIND